MAQLVINHRTVNLNNRILQLRTITSVAKFHGLRPFRFKWSWILAGIVIFIGGLNGLTSSNTLGMGIIACLASGAFVWYAISENLKSRDYWILHVETAAGSRNLLASSDERAIDEGVMGITAAMEADASFQYIVTINDSTIISESTIQNSQVNHMNQSSASHP